MRRSFALLALVLTTWSNVAVSRCAPVVVHPSGHEAAGQLHHYAGHTGDHHGVPESDDGAGNQAPTQSCGVAMACGAALGGQSAMGDRTLPSTVSAIPRVASAAPSPVDLTQDPPPPRRHA